MNICSDANVDTLFNVSLSDIHYVPVPEAEEWKIPLLQELIEIRSGRLQSNLSRCFYSNFQHFNLMVG